MIDRRSIGPVLTITAVLAVTVLGIIWILQRPINTEVKAPPAVPANVVKAAKEDDFNTITLPPEAEKALAIQTAKAERKRMPRERTFNGEVMIPAGQTMIVSAPLSGTIVAPETGVPKPGTVIEAKKPIFLLRPLLTPDGQATMAAAKVDAEGQVKNAQAAFELAKIALDRVQQLLKDGSGSQRMVDEANTAFVAARETLSATTERRDLLKKVLGDASDGTASPISISAPENWLVRNISVSPGQTVPAGAALFEVMNLATMWIRVPLTGIDLDEIDEAGPAKIGPLAAKPGEYKFEAQPIAAPPAANALAATVDRFYTLDNNQPKFSPGERIAVALPLESDADNLTVPWSAVVHDFHGGTWIYEQLADRTYARRRVVVQYVAGTTAVLKEGKNDRVKAGTTVVTAGAAELFGTETGYGK
jgi:biotin carboxyl carrier protein